MAQPTDPPDLLNQLRAGDERAAQHVFDAYVDSLLHLARKRISQRLARRVDPEDIVQSVFRTFFRRVKSGQLVVAEEDDLGKLLTRITVRKALRQAARHTAAKRDCTQEGDACAAAVPAHQPSADVVVAFLDLLEHFFAALRPQDRQVLELRLEGHGTLEIAQQLGTSDRHVRRILEHIRAVVEQEHLLS